ncbi:MAG: LamG domain-containing protein [Planctomycetota bacterium]
MRRSSISLFLICVGLVMFPSVRPLAAEDLSQKKIIKLYGWERPDTAGLRANIDVIRRSGFDGLGINVMPNSPIAKDLWGDSGNYLWFGAHALTREDFSNAVADLKATDLGPLTDNFIHVAARGPNACDWFDPGWQIVVANARVLGSVARDGGLTGITFDVEDGGQFFYNETRRGARPFDVYAARVRDCGRAWMSALREDFPEIALFLTHGYFCTADYMDRYGLTGPEYADYALLPVFLDGLLEGAGDSARVIDGHELTYPFMCRKTFADHLSRSEAAARALCGVPDLYPSRMSHALSVWTGFPNDYGSRPLSQNLDENHFSPSRLEHALYNALCLSDKYVWVWSGANGWWPATMPCYDGRKTFPMPKPYYEALANARSPHDPDWTPRPPAPLSSPPAGADESSLSDLWTEYERLAAVPAEWWFHAEPDVLFPEFLDVFDGWSQMQLVGLDERSAGWSRVLASACWESQGIPYDGAAWYRTRFQAPAGLQGRNLSLCFANVLGEPTIYAACVGRGSALKLTPQRDGNRLMVPLTGLVRDGAETFLALRIWNANGPGGIAGPVVLLGRKGEKPVTITGRRTLLDLDLSVSSGGRVPDASGLGNDAAVSGAAPAPQGLSFDGSKDFLDCGNSPSLLPSGDQISWEIFFSPVAEVKQDIVYHILVAQDPSYLNGLYLDYLQTPNRIVFHQGFAQGAPSFRIPDYSRFYHVVGTYDGTAQRLYVDGKLVAVKHTPVPPRAGDAHLLIAGGVSDAPRFSKCLIRRVRLYNYCLSPDEIARLAASSLAPTF